MRREVAITNHHSPITNRRLLFCVLALACWTSSALARAAPTFAGTPSASTRAAPAFAPSTFTRTASTLTWAASAVEDLVRNPLELRRDGCRTAGRPSDDWAGILRHRPDSPTLARVSLTLRAGDNPNKRLRMPRERPRRPGPTVEL